MTLVHRSQEIQGEKGGARPPQTDDSQAKMKPRKTALLYVALGLISLSIQSFFFSQDPGPGVTIKRTVGTVATVIFKMKYEKTYTSTFDAGEMEIDSGTHKVQVKPSYRCEYPRFGLRLVGSALVHIYLKKSGSIWEGSFQIPLEGQYQVEMKWFGCDKDDSSIKSIAGFDSPVRLVVATGATPPATSASPRDALFGNSVWVATRESSSGYLWKKPEKASVTEGGLIELPNNVTVAIEGTAVPPNGFYKFSEVGNYELVCFLGGPKMLQLRDLFNNDVRKSLFPRQRPFKFRYWNLTSIFHPDKDWPEGEKERIRKCKHLLVSVDELDDDPISSEAFKSQFTKFVYHLTKVVHDESFPVWMFTVSEPAFHATHCADADHVRTTDHPCNEVIKALFRSEAFPKQVHLMDNTDVALPRFGEAEDDVMAIIAMRCFVAVGKGVKDWRDMGQRGLIDGLHRNDKVEPNFELVAYTDWD